MYKYWLIKTSFEEIDRYDYNIYSREDVVIAFLSYKKGYPDAKLYLVQQEEVTWGL